MEMMRSIRQAMRSEAEEDVITAPILAYLVAGSLVLLALILVVWQSHLRPVSQL